ncbi:hypothetical protein M405DRAFT_816841 [Rhizopogon salebrosus TDB-379]|nr:hypothetical protein M405DRAFT_816841 [Rhizopogon salebrosus TDB-379]
MPDLEKTAHSSLKLAQEQPLLLRPSRLRRVMCVLALGHSGHREHWTSAQCDEAFEQVGDRMHSIVVKCLFMSGGLTLTSIALMRITRSTPPHHDYASSTPCSFLIMSLWMGMFGQCSIIPYIIIIFFFHPITVTDLLKRGGFPLAVYCSSICTPLYFATSSLHFFLFALVTTGFSSKNIVYRALGAQLLGTYAVVVGTLLMKFRKRGTSSGLMLR